MNRFLLLGTAFFAVAAFSAYKAFAANQEEDKIMNTDNAKILVAYYSYSGNTKNETISLKNATNQIKTETQAIK